MRSQTLNMVMGCSRFSCRHCRQASHCSCKLVLASWASHWAVAEVLLMIYSMLHQAAKINLTVDTVLIFPSTSHGLRTRPGMCPASIPIPTLYSGAFLFNPVFMEIHMNMGVCLLPIKAEEWQSTFMKLIYLAMLDIYEIHNFLLFETIFFSLFITIDLRKHISFMIIIFSCLLSAL